MPLGDLFFKLSYFLLRLESTGVFLFHLWSLEVSTWLVIGVIRFPYLLYENIYLKMKVLKGSLGSRGSGTRIFYPLRRLLAFAKSKSKRGVKSYCVCDNWLNHKCHLISFYIDWWRVGSKSLFVHLYLA